jgi:ferritin-like metal-binding protein YciE
VPAKQLNERDAKLVQWLQEAHAKESELETDLTAHIALTEKPAYKKRLKQHLTETRAHKRAVASRIKKLGGKLDTGVSGAVAEVAGKGVAAVKGQVGVIRAAVTEQTETHLRNVQEELREEHVEITLYNRIEAFANEVGDKDTARMVATIRREEERMAKFLHAELMRLVKQLVRVEIPREQRQNGSRRAKTSTRARTGARTSRTSSARTSPARTSS